MQKRRGGFSVLTPKKSARTVSAAHRATHTLLTRLVIQNQTGYTHTAHQPGNTEPDRIHTLLTSLVIQNQTGYTHTHTHCSPDW